MATFQASLVRAVALELKQKTMTMYLKLLPIFSTASRWVLNGLDPALPEPFDVKVQLDAYKAITLERLKLDDWVTALQAAAVDDTLTYPPLPELITGGQISFDELSFETFTF